MSRPEKWIGHLRSSKEQALVLGFFGKWKKLFLVLFWFCFFPYNT